jgi:hypothetical protein
MWEKWYRKRNSVIDRGGEGPVRWGEFQETHGVAISLTAKGIVIFKFNWVFIYIFIYLHCMLHYYGVILHALLLHIPTVSTFFIYSMVTYYPILYSILYCPWIVNCSVYWRGSVEFNSQPIRNSKNKGGYLNCWFWIVNVATNPGSDKSCSSYRLRIHGFFNVAFKSNHL